LGSILNPARGRETSENDRLFVDTESLFDILPAFSPALEKLDHFGRKPIFWWVN
jgi:hypothetical protein